MDLDSLGAFCDPLKKPLLMLTACVLVTSGQLANAQTVVPPDAQPTCVVPAAEFKNWFASGSVTANGTVDHADSVTFVAPPTMRDCSFYKWSAQMFLWLTSPAPPKLAQTGLVFESPIFYDVSPPDADRKRTLIPNTPGQMRNFSVNISQRGPLNQPVAFDQKGNMFTIVRPEVGPSGKALIRNQAREKIEIEGTQVAPDGKPVFLDKAGKAIAPQATRKGLPSLLDPSGKRIDLRPNAVVLNGKRVFLNAAGAAVDVEHGQADGNVLIAQGGSLVYYALQVNDVFAYFLTGAKNGGITPTPTQFPTTPADLDKIKAFGLTHGKTFPDANALAIEIKSAWIEATGLDPSKYVTISAVIPTFDTSDPNGKQWVVKGSKQAQLALVGMHVVGSVAGHPEMVWATFEHVGNTPNAAYSYNSTGGLKAVPQDAAGNWRFSGNPATTTPNQPRMLVNGPNIDAIPGQTIGPSDLLRLNAWGTPAGDLLSITNNTHIISLNNSVIGMLAAGDLRKNYILTGATWTAGGQPPSDANQVGTYQLANTTMESFTPTSNCFRCHRGNNMLGTPSGGGLSHIYGPLKALFP